MATLAVCSALRLFSVTAVGFPSLPKAVIRARVGFHRLPSFWYSPSINDTGRSPSYSIVAIGGRPPPRGSSRRWIDTRLPSCVVKVTRGDVKLLRNDAGRPSPAGSLAPDGKLSSDAPK